MGYGVGAADSLPDGHTTAGQHILALQGAWLGTVYGEFTVGSLYNPQVRVLTRKSLRMVC